MRKQITRFISGILTVIMLLSSVNVPVMAGCEEEGTSHSWNDIGDVDWEGDCTTGGKQKIECSSCHTISYNDIPGELNHSWDEGVCDKCLAEHPHGEDIITKTPIDENKHKVSHSVCYLEYEVEHVFSGGTCTECSYICLHPLAEYKYEKIDDNAHKVLCGVEGCEKTVTASEGHDYVNGKCSKCKHSCTHDWDAVKAECKICHIKCTSHNWRAKDGKCGTCGFVCTSDTRVQGAVTWKDGDCTKGGVQDITCSTCGKTISANSPVTAKEKHTYSQGTCTVCGKADPNACQHPVEKLVWEDNNDGKTHKLSCGVESCKVVISANEIHTYPKGVCACGAIDPNCKHEGTTHMVATAKTHDYICDICGKVAKSEKHIFDKNAKCTVCGANPCGGKHTADYVSIASNKHQKYCTKCGFVIKTNIKCSWSIEKYDDKDDWDEDGHSVYCKACGNTEFKDHSFGYEYTDGDKHKKSCGCGVYYEQSCDYDSGKCKLCGHDKGGSSSSSSGSGAAYYAPTDLESLRKAGKALARDIITVKVNGASYDIAAVEAPLRDMANQYFIGNILLTQLGYNLLTPTKTYKLSSYNFYAAPNQAQTIVWKNTGLKAGDVAYVVYWNPTHKTQLLPCVVAADGSATFTVPDINGAICTLVKCEKVTPPAPAKKKK